MITMFKKCLLPQIYLKCKQLPSLQKRDKLDWVKQEQRIMEPFEYLQRMPSKHHRLMVTAFNHWLQAPEEKVKLIENLLQTLHTASLILDDIQDKSASRYGMPSAHCVYSMGLTVNAACNGLIIAGKKALELGHPSAPQIYLSRVEEMHQGQGIDLYWGDHFICPTEEEHLDMLRKKSASFFILPVELLQLFSKSELDNTRLSRLAMNIGIFYPMIDDYYNLFYPQGLQKLPSVKLSSENHITCSDITESKITLAVIHASQFPDVATELADIFKQRTCDPVLHSRAISLLKKHGSDEYLREAVKTVEAEIRAEIENLGGNPILTKFMDDLSFQQKNEIQRDHYKCFDK